MKKKWPGKHIPIGCCCTGVRVALGDNKAESRIAPEKIEGDMMDEVICLTILINNFMLTSVYSLVSIFLITGKIMDPNFTA